MTNWVDLGGMGVSLEIIKIVEQQKASEEKSSGTSHCRMLKLPLYALEAETCQK